MAQTQQTWTESPALVLRRGPYIIAAGLDDFDGTAAPVTLKGRFIPLFDAAQTVVNEYTIGAGARGLLVDLDRYPKDHVGVVAAACRVTNEVVSDETVTFDAVGQADTNAVVSLLLPRPPRAVTINAQALAAHAFDFREDILRLRFANHAEPVKIAISR
jgi:hypothetical protein